MKETWRFIKGKLELNLSAILLIVIDNKGSSPGQAGFKMAIASDGSMVGSIGGGETEFHLVELAKKELENIDQNIFLRKEVHRPNAGEENSGMICSGEQWVAFYPITSKEETAIISILESFENKENGIIHFSQNGFTFNPGEVEHHKHQNPVTSMEEWIYSEPIGKTNQLYIFGAGHVGLALSDIASKLGFEIHIFDDRDQLNTLIENSSAKSKNIIDYNKAVEHVPDGDHVYVVIMTFGHKSDELVLNQLLPKKVKYLGMMGSKKKVNTIFNNLEKVGVKRDVLQNAHAPIGIKISSQTPYEIAISIVAEMIAMKNN